MNRLTIRRVRNLSILTMIAVGIIFLESIFSSQLVRTTTLSGWLLFVLVLLLAAYQLRKMVPVINLGSTASWLQIHIYVGLVTFVVFALHTGLKLPSHLFNVVLFLCYLGLFLSGLVGLFLTRIIPARLTHRGEEVIFERIPIYRNQINKEVNKIIHVEVKADEEVMSFFKDARNVFWHILQSRQPRRKLLRKLESKKQILNEEEKQSLHELQEWVIAKDDLDYSFAMQGCLKVWLFIHIPLTYGLIVLALFHLILVSAFSGGTV